MLANSQTNIFSIERSGKKVQYIDKYGRIFVEFANSMQVKEDW
jgi:hypothetical protein